MRWLRHSSAALDDEYGLVVNPVLFTALAQPIVFLVRDGQPYQLFATHQPRTRKLSPVTIAYDLSWLAHDYRTD